MVRKSQGASELAEEEKVVVRRCWMELHHMAAASPPNVIAEAAEAFEERARECVALAAKISESGLNAELAAEHKVATSVLRRTLRMFVALKDLEALWAGEEILAPDGSWREVVRVEGAWRMRIRAEPPIPEIPAEPRALLDLGDKLRFIASRLRHRALCLKRKRAAGRAADATVARLRTFGDSLKTRGICMVDAVRLLLAERAPEFPQEEAARVARTISDAGTRSRRAHSQRA